MSTSNPALQTLTLHAGQSHDPASGACAVPIYMTSSYVFDSTQDAVDIFSLQKPGNIYTRLGNPTTNIFEERMAALDGGSGALATASGMSATFLAIINIAGAGDHIITSASLYGGTATLFEYSFPRFGIEVTFIEDITAEKVTAAVKPNTKLVYLETIGNPKGDMPDLLSISEAAHAAGLPVFADNTFAPGVFRPIDFGADVVVYSCTKWIGGHGTALGGMIVDGGRFDWGSGRFPEFTEPDPSYHGMIYQQAFGNMAFIVKARTQGMRNLGPCISPFNAFQLMQGLETLMIRMKVHSENTMALATWLRNHPMIEWVNFIGFEDHPHHHLAKKYFTHGFKGALFGMGVKGGAEAASTFIDSVKLALHLANVGDAKTLVINPWTTTHQQLSDEAKRACGMTPGFIRVSVGLEDIEDIKADFDQALQAARAVTE